MMRESGMNVWSKNTEKINQNNKQTKRIKGNTKIYINLRTVSSKTARFNEIYFDKVELLPKLTAIGHRMLFLKTGVEELPLLDRDNPPALAGGR